MSSTRVTCTIDLSAAGKQFGALQVPRSSNQWSALCVPIVSVANGAGPTVLVIGGVHGDEPEGQVAALKLARTLRPEQVTGRVVVIPCASPEASRAYTRTWPSGINFNRSFPGDRLGTEDQQLAHFLSTELFPLSDVVVDIHSGGVGGLHLPWAEMHWVDDPAQRRAMVEGMIAWNTDWCCVYMDIGGTGLLVGEAERQGKNVISTELGGGGHVTAEIHRLAESGLANVLRHVGVLEGEVVKRDSPPTFLRATELENFLRAPESGLFETLVHLGQRVDAGEPVGRIHFLERPDREPETVPAGNDGIVCVVRAVATCEQGDNIVVVAREVDRSELDLMERFTVAATQVDVRHLDVEHNLETHLRLIAETAEAGCDLVVFPETSVTGNNGSPDVTRFAEPHDGRIFRTIQEQAKECGIVVSYGFCELYRGTHYNTSALVGPDGLIGLQRKVHASFDEFFRFRQAYEWGVYDLGFCTVGTAICHDSDFFESWRILALKGAEVILLPHANRTMPAGGGVLTFDGRERELGEDDMLRAQEELLEDRPSPPRLHDFLARDNGVYAVFSDMVGFDGHSTHVGGAYVLAPDGSMLARSEPGIANAWIAVELDPALVERARENPWFALKKRRPEAYDELVVRQ